MAEYDPREDPRYLDRRNRYADDYRQRSPPKKPWYKKWWIWTIVGVIILLFLISLSGNLKLPSPAVANITANQSTLTEEQQLVNYIITQQQAGINNENITQRLKLAGYDDSTIQRAYDLSDPVVQYILTEMVKGTSKPLIVDSLLQRGYTPEEIQKKFAIAESTKAKNLWQSIQDNWLIILIAAGIIAFIIYKSRQEEEKVTTKIYTLEECREYAEELLKKKNYDFNPCKEYRNRPELRQYRYIFEEPLIAEFNTPNPSGFKAGERRYYFLAVGYDRELIDFRVLTSDSDIRDFLYNRPPPFELRSGAEYLRMRQGSEQPIPENMPIRPGIPGQQYPYTTKYNEAYYKQRFRPGPITGYEEPWL
jgi:hypothetical protein